MYSEKLIIKLNTIAHQYKDVINQRLNSILSQPKYRNTGAGLASLHVDVIDGDQSKAPQIIITMDEHLLLIDKRKMQWTKLPDVRKLLEWAETKTFDEVPGYKGKVGIDKAKVAQRVAYAIAVTQRKTDSFKRKPWRKSGLGPALSKMNKNILQSFDEAIEQDLATAFKKNN